MYYTYVLISINHDYLYKGHCENLDERLKEHNSGMTESIRPYVPFKVGYIERFDTREEAIRRERYFKTAAGRRFIKDKLVP
jgi:putative endonuclease